MDWSEAPGFMPYVSVVDRPSRLTAPALLEAELKERTGSAPTATDTVP